MKKYLMMMLILTSTSYSQFNTTIETFLNSKNSINVSEKFLMDSIPGSIVSASFEAIIIHKLGNKKFSNKGIKILFEYDLLREHKYKLIYLEYKEIPNILKAIDEMYKHYEDFENKKGSVGYAEYTSKDNLQVGIKFGRMTTLSFIGISTDSDFMIRFKNKEGLMKIKNILDSIYKFLKK